MVANTSLPIKVSAVPGEGEKAESIRRSHPAQGPAPPTLPRDAAPPHRPVPRMRPTIAQAVVRLQRRRCRCRCRCRRSRSPRPFAGRGPVPRTYTPTRPVMIRAKVEIRPLPACSSSARSSTSSAPLARLQLIRLQCAQVGIPFPRIGHKGPDKVGLAQQREEGERARVVLECLAEEGRVGVFGVGGEEGEGGGSRRFFFFFSYSCRLRVRIR